MKNIFFITLLVLNFSCNDEKEQVSEDDVVTRWRLISRYFNPGDNSGEFVDVTSAKNIEFLKSGMVRSNGNLCNMDIETDVPTEASQSFKDSNVILHPVNCPNLLLYIYYLPDDILDIVYPCDEGCTLRFKRIK